MVTYRGHRYAISAPAPCTSRFGGHRGSWRRSNGECSCDGQQGHRADGRVGGWRDPVLLAGVDRDERLCDARGYLQAFSSGGGALLEGVGRRADAALDLFHPSWARDPRQQRDATSRVTCVARLHPDRTRECRQAICARQRRGTEQHESCSDRWTSRPRCERSDTSSATASPQTGTGLRRGGFRRALLPVPRNTVICLVSARPTAVFSLASPLDAWVGGPSPLGGGSPESPASHSVHATSSVAMALSFAAMRATSTSSKVWPVPSSTAVGAGCAAGRKASAPFDRQRSTTAGVLGENPMPGLALAAP